MQLTKKLLKEKINKYYLISNYIDIVIRKNDYFILYPYNMVKIMYSNLYGWSFAIYGETTYSLAKYILDICNYLDANKYTPIKEKK